jgi:hypothetical protein
MTLGFSNRDDARDAGSITVIVAVLVPALLLVVALVVDGAGKMRALMRADAVAAEAARAAETAVNTRGRTVTIDLGTAVAAAHTYLRQAGYPGTVSIDGARTVHVTVALDAPAAIGLLGATYHVTGSATAQLTAGTSTAVDGGGGL